MKRSSAFHGNNWIAAMPVRHALVVLAATVAVQTCLAAASSISTPPPEGEPALAGVDRPSHQMSRRIDELLMEQWTAGGVTPASSARDGEFLRRAHLDLTGAIPRVSEVRDFLADPRPDKRMLLIDRLLDSPRYATHMATTWRNRILPLGVDSSHAVEALGLQKWLRTRFAKNLRYDNIVGGLLLTTGGDDLGPALYFRANDVAPEKMAASAAELFLGVRLECAQCHDHPTADWSQRDFWALAAFFARVKAPSDRGGMQTSYRLTDADGGEVTLPDSTEQVAPKYPGGDASTDSPRQTRRAQLAIWMTSRENNFFARAAVNWAWTHLFGHGLVESVDGKSGQSPPANLQLLDELAADFIQSDFDLKDLWRTLASTRAYQLSCQQENPESTPPELFARMLPKSLTPEQLYDSFLVMAPPRKTAASSSSMTISLDEDPVRLEFVRRMRTPPGSITEYRAGTLQVLMLMNGGMTNGLTAPNESSLLEALNAPFMTHADQIDTLFLATLSRQPDDEEKTACINSLAECQTPIEKNRALSDMLWALLNSTEFAFNR